MSEVSLINPNGGYNNGNWGGDFIGAAIGGALGSAWGGNGWGNRGGWNNGGGTGIAENAILGSLNSVKDGQNNIAMALQAGQSRGEMTACQGFNGINTAILTSSANQTNWTNQGFANTNQNLQNLIFGLSQQGMQQGFDTRAAIAGVSSQMADCCCNLRQEMSAGFAAIGAQMAANQLASAQEKLCDAKAEINRLKTEQFITASQLGQSAYIRSIIPETTTAAAAAA